MDVSKQPFLSIVQVQFDNTAQTYSFRTIMPNIPPGTNVIVKTKYGVSAATTFSHNQPITAENLKQATQYILCIKQDYMAINQKRELVDIETNKIIETDIFINETPDILQAFTNNISYSTFHSVPENITNVYFKPTNTPIIQIPDNQDPIMTLLHIGQLSEYSFVPFLQQFQNPNEAAKIIASTIIATIFKT